MVAMRWVLAAALFVGCKGTPNKPAEPARAETTAAAATAAGAEARMVEVAGDHFVVIDPAVPAWARTLEVLDEISPPAPA